MAPPHEPSPPAAPPLAGAARRAQRTTILAVIGVAALTAVVSLVFVFTQQPQVQADVTSFDPTPNPAPVTLVVKKSADRAFRCTVVVEDVDHDVLGQADTVAARGQGTVTNRFVVPYTGGPAFAAEVTDCIHLN